MIRFEQTTHYRNQAGLAGTIGAEQTKKAALGDIQIHTVKRRRCGAGIVFVHS